MLGFGVCVGGWGEHNLMGVISNLDAVGMLWLAAWDWL